MEMNAVLLKDTIISAEEYRQAQSKDYNKKMSIPQLTSSILENQIQKRDKVKEIEELDHEAEKQFISFQQALQTLRSNVENWIRQYVLKSAVEGTVYFMLPLQQNQFIQQGKILGYINPSNDKFFVELFLPQNNLGKVDTGMEVQLRFDAYPYHECGFVTGKLSYISSVVSDSGYLSIVELDKGLKTNFNRELQYKYGLKADAMIITKRTNLMKRIYYGLLEKKQ
jgi:HlyD family secretion protein